MAFIVVRRTWGPDTMPRSSSAPVSIDIVNTCDTLREAERLAKNQAAEFPASGYNPERDYWWGRDSDFRYTFTVEGPRRYPPVMARSA